MYPREERHLPVSSKSFYSYVFICLSACTGDGQLLGVIRPVNSEPPIISLSADKQTYAPGDTIELTLDLRNDSDDPLVLDFVTGQRYDFAILTTQEDTVWPETDSSFGISTQTTPWGRWSLSLRG